MAATVWTVSNLLVGITSVILIFILLRYGKNKTHYLWAFFNVSLGTWGFGVAAAGLCKNADYAIIAWKIGLLGGIFCGVISYHFVTSLAELNRNVILVIAYILSIIFGLGVIFDWLGAKIVYAYDSLYCLQGFTIGFRLFMLGWMALVIWMTYELYMLVRRTSGTKRLQYIYILAGFIIGYIGGFCNVGVMIGYTPVIFSGTNILIIFYCTLITYAILRHKLLDIEIIIRKTLVFAGLLASVFGILILPTLLIQEYIFRTASFGGRLIGLAISGIIIILTMRRIENFLVNITDKYLFQKKYDYKELLRTFTAEVLTVLELDRLLDLTVDKLTDIIKIKSSAVLLLDEEKQEFDVKASQGIKDAEVTLVRPDGIVTFLEQTHGYLLVKELKDKKIFIPPTIQEIIEKLSAELIIPMVLHDDVMGILSLGKKKSDEEYTQDDLDIILPLARTLAIAISNAKLFVELGKTQAEAAQREKMAVIGTLSAGINHEICNPLGIARGQCEAFLLNISDGLYKNKTTNELLKKAQEIMAKVIHETDRATAITKKLSSFAKPAKGEAELVNVDKEIDEVIGLVGYELKLEKIEFTKDVAKDLPDIFVDKKQIQEVLFNLIRNAGQAIGEKGRINVSAYQNKGKIFIEIKDSGSGIPEDKIKMLFNPFFTTKEPGKGTGLGLFIVRQVVEKNGGRIYLKETKVNEGTTFTLEFPAAAREGMRVNNG